MKQEILNIIAKSKKTAGTYFNPLGIWGHDKEVPNSGAIKALLNPSDEEYCIKGEYSTLFLKKFIDLLELDLGNVDYKNVQVSAEHSSKDYKGDSHGRVDIQINVDKDTVIFIENKINAELDSEQLGKYYFPHKAKNKYMVYLSKEGVDPTPQSLKFKNKSLDKGDVICISYYDIAEWLKSCLNNMTSDEEYAPLRLGVQMYLDNIYNIIEDDRSVHSIWAKVYKDILKFIQEKNISLADLEKIKNTLVDDEDKDKYIQSVIEIIKMRNFIIKSYQTIASKFPKEDIHFIYEDDRIQDTSDIKDIENDATEILTNSYAWLGLAICVWHGENPLYYGFYLNEATYMLVSFICRREENPDTLAENIYNKYKETYQIHSEDEAYYAMTDSNVDKFISVVSGLRKDFSSIETCEKYLAFKNNAIVFLKVMDYLKQQSIECNLTHTNLMDLSLMNNDWWLYFGDIFALGYGAGSMWLFINSMDEEGKKFVGKNKIQLEKLEFNHGGDRFNPYGKDFWEFVFENSDKISEKDIEKFTKAITKKIDELLNLKK